MKTSDPRQLTVEEIQHELAQILATGYLRLCDEVREGGESTPSQQRSGALDGQDSASAGPGERP